MVTLKPWIHWLTPYYQATRSIKFIKFTIKISAKIHVGFYRQSKGNPPAFSLPDYKSSKDIFMKIFANGSESRFFATDDYVKGLHEVEICDVQSLVKTIKGVDINVLLGNRFFQADDIDELIITEDDGFTPVTPYWFDFLDRMTAAEIAASALTLHEYSDTAKLIDQLKALWEYTTKYEDGLEEFLFIATDGSKLAINIHHFSESIKTTSYLKTTNPALIPPFR